MTGYGCWGFARMTPSTYVTSSVVPESGADASESRFIADPEPAQGTARVVRRVKIGPSLSGLLSPRYGLWCTAQSATLLMLLTT